MEESLPSISAGVVGSRFVSQTDIEAAKQRREEQWKAAYARLGQEPPPQPVEDSWDGRSLAEKLAANRAAKQEEWEEKTKLANQFRALEEDEIMFLDSIREKQEEEERRRREIDQEEVKSFKEAVAARESASNNSPPIVGARKPSGEAPKIIAAPAKKDMKKPLKGVIVKKKPKASTSSSSAAASASRSQAPSPPEMSGSNSGKRKHEDQKLEENVGVKNAKDGQADGKRPRVSESDA